MKLIPLTQGQFAQVDDWNYDWLNQWKWFAQKVKNSYYAERHIYQGGKQKTVAMHREIMNTPFNMEVDHKDHDGLNCLEENMRNCNHRQNNMNRKSFGSSRYIGVSYLKKNNMYVSRIRIEGCQIYIGWFKDEEVKK